MRKQYWLVKQEPETYPWAQFVADGETVWEGVRNFQARNHLRAMQVGDEVLFYASGNDKAVVGTATVARAAFPDPTAQPGEGDWSAVRLRAGQPLPRPVTLAEIKADAMLQDIPLVRQSRLSVLPLTAAAFRRIGQLAKRPSARD
jgi:predicted RNA-binding protein with PUA-like domain